MNSYRKYTQDIIFTGISNFVLAARGLILLPMITKVLGPSGYGMWTQIIVTLSLMTPMATLNLAASLARFLSTDKSKEEIRESFFSVVFASLGASFFLTLAGWVLAEPAARFLFGTGESASLVRLTAVLLPLWAMDVVCLGFFRGLVQIRTHAVIVLLRDFVEVGFVALLVLLDYGIWGALLGLIITRVLSNTAMLVVIISRIGIRVPHFLKLRTYLRFGLPLIPGMLASWVVNAGDRYVIAYYLGVTSVGVYSAGYSIGNVIAFFLGPLSVVMMPTLSRAYEGHEAEVKTYLTYSLKFFLMLAIPSVFGLAILAKPILMALSTPDFVAVGSRVIPFIATGFVMFGVYVVFSQVLVLVNRTAIIGLLWVFIGLLNLGLNIIFVPRLGPVGAAGTTLFCYTLTALVMVVYSRRFITFEVRLLFVAKSILASLVMAVVVWLLRPEGLSSILAVIALGATLYFIVLFALRGFSGAEIAFFRQFLTRR